MFRGWRIGWYYLTKIYLKFAVSGIPENYIWDIELSSVPLEWFRTTVLCWAKISTSLVPVLSFKYFIVKYSYFCAWQLLEKLKNDSSNGIASIICGSPGHLLFDLTVFFNCGVWRWNSKLLIPSVYLIWYDVESMSPFRSFDPQLFEIHSSSSRRWIYWIITVVT